MPVRAARKLRQMLGPLLALCALSPAMSGAEQPALEQPLSLEYALSLPLQTHPTLNRSRAALALAQAQQQQSDADNALSVTLSLDARYVEPPEQSTLGLAGEHNDSRAALLVNKRLYDFGRNQHNRAAAAATVRSARLSYQDLRARQRLEIMRRFFDVILADLAFASDNEAMSTDYVALDRARERNTLGQVSDIDVLELQDRYQSTRLRRYAAQTRQRSTRALLAQTLGRPTDLPSALLNPALPGNDAALPEYEVLLDQALAHNPQRQALQQAWDAARQQIEASRAQARPVLNSYLEANAYQQDVGSRDPFRAGLILDIPLYTGGRTQAQIARAQAAIDEARARLGEFDYQLSQEILETWQAIQTLHAQREQANVRLDYRDLYLDRSRARYELDIKSDLGDAMAEQSAAQLFARQTEFALALSWAQLAVLTGVSAYDPLTLPASPPTHVDTP